jgi:hypothetical protein
MHCLQGRQSEISRNSRRRVHSLQLTSPFFPPLHDPQVLAELDERDQRHRKLQDEARHREAGKEVMEMKSATLGAGGPPPSRSRLHSRMSLVALDDESEIDDSVRSVSGANPPRDASVGVEVSRLREQVAELAAMVKRLTSVSGGTVGSGSGAGEGRVRGRRGSVGGGDDDDDLVGEAW